MKKDLEVITAKFEQVVPKDRKIGFWDFLTICSVLIFAIFYLLLFNPIGWIAIVLCTLLYKFVIGG
jgi:type II secretory pathway component PulM